jgi:hypothetical protein
VIFSTQTLVLSEVFPVRRYFVQIGRMPFGVKTNMFQFLKHFRFRGLQLRAGLRPRPGHDSASPCSHLRVGHSVRGGGPPHEVLGLRPPRDGNQCIALAVIGMNWPRGSANSRVVFDQHDSASAEGQACADVFGVATLNGYHGIN